MPEFAAWQWGLGVFCAFMVGVAKTGVPAAGTPIAPLMVLLVGDARLAAGHLLPMLCVGDLFAVAYWRRHAHVNQLLRLAPWVLAGLALGAAALALDEGVLRKMVGFIVLAMLLLFVRNRQRKEESPAPLHPAPYGVTAGFATTVANAAGSVMNLYLLGMRLPKLEFVGTAAWFFFVINLAKTPVYAAHGLFSPASLVFDAIMVPPVIGGAITGRWLIQHIPQRAFEVIVMALTLAAAILLFR